MAQRQSIMVNLFEPAQDVVTRAGRQSRRALAGQGLEQPQDFLSLGAALLLPLLAGGLGAVATNSSVSTWYRRLKKPPWNPPAWVFGPVWTVLYLMMGLASWLVWQKRPAHKKKVGNALTWYGLQFTFNSLWSPLFFGLRRTGLAMADIVALWGALLTCLVKFGRVQPLAGWLLVPYFLWVSFASTLNAAVWWLNRNRS